MNGCGFCGNKNDTHDGESKVSRLKVKTRVACYCPSHETGEG